MERRTIIKALALASQTLPFCAARAQGPDDIDYEDYAGPLPELRLYGDKPSLPAENKKARTLLDGAPRNQPVLDVARYFEGITETNQDGERYNAAWASRWNPVIVGFYKSTQLADKYVYIRGDTIAWCAAFLNWCLAAAGQATTNSASSGSFRTYGTASTTPRPGDIVVFKSALPERARQGFGHVGLFLDQHTNRIKGREEITVLGGNQKAGKRYSSVNVSVFPLQSSSLILHSVRRA